MPRTSTGSSSSSDGGDPQVALDADSYAPFVTSDGKTVPSFAERVQSAVSKHVLTHATPPRREDLEFALSLTELVGKRTKGKGRFIPYYRGRLLVELGDVDGGIASLRRFTGSNVKEWWAWRTLAEALLGKDADAAHKAAARAVVLCPEDFKRLALGLLERSAQAARTELPDGDGLRALASSASEILFGELPWERGVAVLPLQRKGRRDLARFAVQRGDEWVSVVAPGLEECVAFGTEVELRVVPSGRGPKAVAVRLAEVVEVGSDQGLPWRVGVVTAVDAARGTVQVQYALDGKGWVPAPEGFTHDVGDAVRVVVSSTDRGRAVVGIDEAVAWEYAAGGVGVIRTEGPLEVTSAGFGFVDAPEDRVFVPPDLVPAPVPSEVQVVAVRAIDRKRGVPGWRAIALHPKAVAP